MPKYLINSNLINTGIGKLEQVPGRETSQILPRMQTTDNTKY